MAIPNVDRTRVERAIAEYDRKGVEYNWNVNKFALMFNGRPYPPKIIVSMATGLPTTGFSGGDGSSGANTWLRKRGFEIASVPKAKPEAKS